MNEQELRDALAHHGFLHDLGAERIDAIARCATVVEMRQGEYLGREGESAGALYLILSGRVAIEVHAPGRGPVRIQTIGPNEPVGWSWLMPPYRWQFDARVVENGKAIALAAEPLRTQCEKDHELGYQIVKRLVGVVSRRLAATRLQLLDIYQ